MSSITLTQYTDPNCTWSWGSEPAMRRLETVFGDQLTIEFVMGGLIEDFDEFHDVANGIDDPGDVAPHWAAAADRHGMPVDAGVWTVDPPHSTYPACIAARAAALQDPRLGYRYLRRLREAAAVERMNIEDRETLVRVAESVGVDVDRFRDAIDDGTATAAFRADLREIRNRGVRGFPTYRIEARGEETILGGFQPPSRLESALVDIVPGLERRDTPPVRSFVATYGLVATATVAHTYGWDAGKAEQVLEAVAAAGDIRSVRRGTGRFWMPADDRGRPRLGTGELSHGEGIEWIDG